MKASVGLMLCVFVAAVAGCRVPEVKRADEVGRFREHLANQTRSLDISPQRKLAVGECEDLAVTNSLSLQVRRMNLKLQDEQVRLALVGGLPSANLNYSDTVRSNEAAVNLGNTTASFEDRHQQRLSIAGVLPVLDFGLTYYSYQIAKDRRAQERLLLERTEQLLRRDVRLAYTAAAGAIRQQKLAALANEAAARVLKVARALEREKMAVRADTALVEATVAQANLELSLAGQRVAESKLNLAQLMSLPPGIEFSIVEDLPALPPPPSADEVTAMEDRALYVRPELAVQDLERHASAAAVRKEAAAFFPKLDGLGGFYWSNTSSAVNPSFFAGGFQVTHALLDGSATIWRYRLAKGTNELQKAQSLLVSLGVLYEVELRALCVSQAYETVLASDALEQSRREALRRIISLYMQGLEDEAGAARALADLTIQATSLDRAQTDYLLAWHELEAAALPEIRATTRPATMPTTTAPVSRPAFDPSLMKGLIP